MLTRRMDISHIRPDRHAIQIGNTVGKQATLNTGMDSHFVLHTPLMWLDKADTWRLAEDLGGMPLVDCILEQSHTCYEGTRGERYPWGYGCGQCPACKLRAHGYEVYLSRYHQK